MREELLAALSARRDCNLKNELFRTISECRNPNSQIVCYGIRKCGFGRDILETMTERERARTIENVIVETLESGVSRFDSIINKVVEKLRVDHPEVQIEGNHAVEIIVGSMEDRELITGRTLLGGTYRFTEKGTVYYFGSKFQFMNYYISHHLLELLTFVAAIGAFTFLGRLTLEIGKFILREGHSLWSQLFEALH